ncbi:MAG TPA: hypothetical protein VGE45_22250 [Chloroflexia bacterium]|jgi:hypothetical protein
MPHNPPKKVRTKSPGAGGLEHDPLPFEQRYRRALDNAQLRRNLLNFQRSWQVSREGAFSTYAENPERVATAPVEQAHSHPSASHMPLAKGTAEFEAMRDRLAAIKDEVIERLPEYVERFQEAAQARGIIIYRAADAEARGCQPLRARPVPGAQHHARGQEQDDGLGGD